MLYTILATIASINSLLAVMLLLAFYYIKLRYGIEEISNRINRFAGTHAILGVKIYDIFRFLYGLHWLCHGSTF